MFSTWRWCKENPLITFTAILLAGAILFVRFLPLDAIYTDEIGFLVLHGRYFADSGHVITLLPQCSPFASTPPLSWLPFLALHSIVHDYFVDSFDRLRILGGLGGAALSLCFTIFYSRLFLNNRSYAVVLSEAVFPILFGSLPLIISLFRPEALLALYFILNCVLFLRPSPMSKGVVFSFSLVVLHASAFALHPIALTFLPLSLMAYWGGAATIRVKAFFTVLVGLSAWETVKYYEAILSGQSCPAVKLLLKSMSVPLQNLLFNPIELLKAVFDSPGAILTFVEQVSPDWKLQLSSVGGYVERGPLTWMAMIVAIIGFIQIGFACLSLARNRDKLRERESLLFLVALGCVVVSLLGRSHRYFYGAALYLPIFFFLLGLSWKISPDGISNVARRWFCALLVCFSVASMIVYLGDSSIRRYGAHHQPFQNLFYNSERELGSKGEIPQLLATCGFGPVASLQHLMLSDVSYLSFRQSSQPFLRDYISGGYWSEDIPDLVTFLIERDSSGVVVACEELSDELRSHAIRVDGLCCLNRNALAELHF